MPVRKFRSVEEMESPWRSPGDPALHRAIRALWEFGARSGVHRFPPGVYRHRSIEDMNRMTEAWDEANSRATRALRRGRGAGTAS